MNSKGQTLGLAIMTSLFVLIAGLLVVNFLMPEITDFRTNMNCANANSISDGVKLLCLMGDATVPYWIVLVFSLVIGGVTAYFTL
jgi:hypothetical protein